MTLPVHLVPDLDGAASGATVRVEGEEAHHAVAVRRMRAGERLVLTDGAGTVVTGEVAATGRRTLDVTVLDVRQDPAPRPAVTVVQALAKGDRGERAVEALTEIGVARIVPWAASRSVVVWKGERADKALTRWRGTAREAAKQARRAWHPEVTGPMSTQQVTEVLADAAVAMVLHEGAGAGLASLPLSGDGPVVVVVGPEGGLTDEEVAAFVGAGAHSVRLGHEVLRTSTAGLAAVAALLSRTDRWS